MYNKNNSIYKYNNKIKSNFTTLIPLIQTKINLMNKKKLNKIKLVKKCKINKN